MHTTNKYPASKTDHPSKKVICWNCGGEHYRNKCPLPKRANNYPTFKKSYFKPSKNKQIPLQANCSMTDTTANMACITAGRKPDMESKLPQILVIEIIGLSILFILAICLPTHPIFCQGR